MKKIVISLIITLSLISCGSAQKSEFSPEALQKNLINLKNETVTFEDVLKKNKGRVTVIEVWASWCSDCVKAMPKLKAMQEKFKNVNYVFISMDKAMDKWKNGIEKHELVGDHYWSPDGMKGEFGKSIDLDWIPRYIILDHNGKVITYRAIETDFETMYTTLNTLLK